MTAPVNQLPMPPVPSQQGILADSSASFISQPWNQWFIQLKEKVDVIDELLVTISGTGSLTGLFNAISPLTTNGDMLVYASGANTRLGIGTTGQILSVVGGLPAWVNPSAGSSPLTTKGDLYTYSTMNTRLPVGTNGYVLIADSTQTTGLRWGSNAPTLPLTTTGDILTYVTGTGLVRVPVGTNGQVLTARSSATNGIDWETPSVSGVPTGTGYYHVTSGSMDAVSATNQAVARDIGSFNSAGLTAPVASQFTASSGIISAVQKTGRIQVIGSYTTGTNAVMTYNTALPSTPYTIDLGFTQVGIIQFAPTASTLATSFGLFISDGTKYIYLNVIRYTGTSAPFGLGQIIWTDTTLNGTLTTLYETYSTEINFVRITDNGTTRSFYVSPNGLDYTLLFSHATNTFLTPTQTGMMLRYDGTTVVTQKISVYHWLVTPSILGDAS